MRRYIRHPAGIPIDYHVSDVDGTITNRMIDISLGGLCFIADRSIERGTNIHISIPLNFSADCNEQHAPTLEEFDGDGTVAWCRKEGLDYVVGVQFTDKTAQFGVRMVEQVCHIEHYRHDVFRAQGRKLSRDEAAAEWVERFAAEFPTVS